MSQTGMVSWSQTAANNANADSNVNFAEGMAPSQVNDSTRALMASGAKYLADVSGSMVTGGSNTAYTVASNQVFSSLAVMDGQAICIRFNATNGAAPTLSVDSLAAKPINMDLANAIPTGALRTNSIWTLTYNNSSGVFIVHGGAAIDPPGFINPYAGSSAPSGWLFCNGAGISQTTYADLYTAIGTTYGSTAAGMFSVPDLTGRVPAGLEASATRLTTGGSGINGGTLGASGGLETHTLTTAELAAHSHTITDGGHVHGGTGGNDFLMTGGGGSSVSGGGAFAGAPDTASAVTGISVNNAGSGTAHANVQPTLVVNYIIKT